MRRTWFTMIEIILVVLIMAVLFVAFRNVFQVKNKDIVYGQTCVENLYGEINNFVKSAIRSQGLNSWGTTVYPDRYVIDILPSQETITLHYIIDNTSYLYESYELTGNIPNQRYCETNDYSIHLSGADNFLTINKGLWTDAQLRSFRLSGSQEFSLTTDILLYNNGSAVGKNIGQFLIDTRTQAIQKKLCLNINTDWTCYERDK